MVCDAMNHHVFEGSSLVYFCSTAPTIAFENAFVDGGTPLLVSSLMDMIQSKLKHFLVGGTSNQSSQNHLN
jgi:hypothetical protein